MSNKYTVVTDYKWEAGPEDQDVKVNVERVIEADSLKIVENGALVFYTEKKITLAFPQGGWMEVSKIV